MSFLQKEFSFNNKHLKARMSTIDICDVNTPVDVNVGLFTKYRMLHVVFRYQVGIFIIHTLFSMSTKDLSCLLVGETSQGRGSDLSGKRL